MENDFDTKVDEKKVDELIEWINSDEPTDSEEVLPLLPHILALAKKAFELEDLKPTDTWWSYECFGRCGEGSSSGVVIDMRTDNEAIDPRGDPPAVMCPFCGEQMTPKGSWEADVNGYGSGADRSYVTISRASLGKLIASSLEESSR
jgi:hypothetical protein